MSRQMRWSELVEAVTDWQERTGLDPDSLPLLPILHSPLITPPKLPTTFWLHVETISMERGIVLDLEEKP